MTTDNDGDDDDDDDATGQRTQVIYVAKKDAKRVKTKLEQNGKLNKDFRMTPDNVPEQFNKGCIAVPVIKSSSSSSSSSDNNNDNSILTDDLLSLLPKDEGGGIVVLGTGYQYCPYSSSVLGSSRRHHRQQPKTTGSSSTTTTPIQNALLKTCSTYSKSNLPEEKVLKHILSLNNTVCCPKSVEIFGDDKTIIIPRKALNINESTFQQFLSQIIGTVVGDNNNDDDNTNNNLVVNRFMDELWRNLAGLYNSPRIVRKGEIDPESPIRESGCKLIWSSSSSSSSSCKSLQTATVTSEEEDPSSSPTWITVTEQGIKQSFDMAHVMFSRGNITEKIRFGRQLVQKGETVLDMYGGIGYFALPALVHGQAKHVYVCEWNPHAVQALRYNLKQNNVDDRATVFVGDCRVIAKEHNLCNMFDRVSLGLLPSSEGGWETAVRALRRSTGGWLHVHGNVPVSEAGAWCRWLCVRIREHLQQIEDGRLSTQWVVVQSHLEKVKSFAPNVNHYVADVYLGPPLPDIHSHLQAGLKPSAPSEEEGLLELCPEMIVDPPSCALSPSGVLNQAWMR